MNLRTRLRAAPLAALAFAALCFVAAFTTTALPRAVDSYGNAALRDTLTSAPLSSRLVTGTLPVESRLGEDGDVHTPLAQPARVDRLAEEFAAAARPLPVDTERAVAGVANPEPADIVQPALPRLTPSKAPEVTLAAQRGLARHSRLVRGAPPGPEVVHRQSRPGPEADLEQHLEAAVTERTAHRMGLAPGDTFRIGVRYATVVTVTGIVEPLDPGSVFWQAQPELERPMRASRAATSPGQQPERYWHFGALLHREAAAEALPSLEQGAEAYWHLPLNTDGLRAHQVPDLLTGLSALDRGPESAELARAAGAPVTVEEGLGSLLAAFERDRSATAPLLAMAAVGVTTAALTVLVLWGVLAAERRRDELALLRARGCSAPGLAGLLLAETAAAALPAVAAGYGVALWLLPDARPARSLLLAGVVAAVALATLPLRASLAHRRPLAAGARRDGPGGRGGRRRLVAEGAVLVLVVGTVAALRQRGAGGGADPDPLTAAAPVLLSLAVALLLLRCYPLPLRLLARLTARRSGPVAFLGLARAGRAPSAAVTGLPLLSLLVALTIASFGGTVLDGVDEARTRAALHAVGADARIAAPSALPDELPPQVRKVPGVGDVSGVRAYENASLLSGLLQPALVIVDPASYARLAARTGLGAYPAGALEGDDGEGGPVPALISADLAAEWGGGTMQLTAPGLGLSAQPALVRESTPAAPRGTFVVVSRTALEEAQPDIAGTALLRPNVLLLGTDGDGTVDARALRKLTDDAGPSLTLNLAAEEGAAYDDSAIRSGAEDLYAAAVAAAGALSALAVLLSLLQTAPERTSLLARLRTLGMPRHQGRWLILVEALPLYVLTAAAGALLAPASIRLLRPGVDLTALAGTPPGPPARLVPDVPSLVLPALCLLVLAAAALLLQARAAARRSDLRMEPT